MPLDVAAGGRLRGRSSRRTCVVTQVTAANRSDNDNDDDDSHEEEVITDRRTDRLTARTGDCGLSRLVGAVE